MSVFQTAAAMWILDLFGARVADDTEERGYRFMEEALELVQAGGMTKEQVLEQVEYTFSRPKGTVYQEVGGVVLTLATFCQAHGLDMINAAQAELDRCWAPEVMDKIRAKQATKPHGSPLPGSGVSSMCTLHGQHKDLNPATGRMECKYCQPAIGAGENG